MSHHIGKSFHHLKIGIIVCLNDGIFILNCVVIDGNMNQLTEHISRIRAKVLKSSRSTFPYSNRSHLNGLAQQAKRVNSFSLSSLPHQTKITIIFGVYIKYTIDKIYVS